MMKSPRYVLLAFFSSLSFAAFATVKSPETKLVIAHRGASGYLPEHTLASATLAYGHGADFIEPDIVLTQDSIPIVLHDIFLETTTDVAKLFPNRKRADGHWYAIDFKLDELRRLSVHERVDAQTRQVSFPQRFPGGVSLFSIPTLEELILLIQGLNRSTGRQVGLYPELKAPTFHEKAGQDLVRKTLDLLTKYGYTQREAPIFIQCFEPSALRRIRHELKSPLRLIQLIGENSWQDPPGVDFDAMRTEQGLREIAKYADGIGPRIAHVLVAKLNQAQAAPSSTDLTTLAHARGLLVHPYTVRADQLPSYARTVDELHHYLFGVAKVDGVFTDFSDKTRAYLNALAPTLNKGG